MIKRVGRKDFRSNNIWKKEYQVFVEKLKQARIEAGLTQVDVSKKLKRPQSYISKCESGERHVDAIELGVFSRLYKKKLEFFVNGYKK